MASAITQNIIFETSTSLTPTSLRSITIVLDETLTTVLRLLFVGLTKCNLSVALRLISTNKNKKVFTIFDIMTEINSLSGNLSNYRQTKHEKSKQKIVFFTILDILTEFKIAYQSICQTEDTYFQSFGQMTGNFRHLAKWLVWHLDCNIYMFLLIAFFACFFTKLWHTHSFDITNINMHNIYLLLRRTISIFIFLLN